MMEGGKRPRSLNAMATVPFDFDPRNLRFVTGAPINTRPGNFMGSVRLETDPIALPRLILRTFADIRTRSPIVNVVTARSLKTALKSGPNWYVLPEIPLPALTRDNIHAIAVGEQQENITEVVAVLAVTNNTLLVVREDNSLLLLYAWDVAAALPRQLVRSLQSESSPPGATVRVAVNPELLETPAYKEARGYGRDQKWLATIQRYIQPAHDDLVANGRLFATVEMDDGGRYTVRLVLHAQENREQDCPRLGFIDADWARPSRSRPGDNGSTCQQRFQKNPLTPVENKVFLALPGPHADGALITDEESWQRWMAGPAALLH